MSVKVLEMELSGQIVPVDIINGYDNYHILVRAQKQPIGWISFFRDNNNKTQLSEEGIYQAIKEQINQHIISQAFEKNIFSKKAVASKAEPISVVVCTRNRTTNLRACCESLINLKYELYEIIIVDNAPDDDETNKLARTLPVKYIREERPGLDWARNRGIAEARYSIVAFTDDDAVVDAGWLQAISNAFADPELMCVTGYVAPLELETHAQQIFEFGYGGMGHGFRQKLVVRDGFPESQLIFASGFGVGANMAFRKEVFNRIGLFDVALDAGTPSRGGGDVEMFHRLVGKGHKLLYEPGVLVWHTHRRTMSGLRRQIFDNGRSFGCYLLTCIHRSSVRKRYVIKFLLIDWFWKWIIKRLVRPPRKLPRYTALLELFGMLTSPFAYIAAQANAKRISKSRQVE